MIGISYVLHSIQNKMEAVITAVYLRQGEEKLQGEWWNGMLWLMCGGIGKLQL